MESVSRTVWDEWSSLPFENPFEDEIYGILCGLPEKTTADGSIFYTNRLFTLRRMLKLWGGIVAARGRELGVNDIKLTTEKKNGRISFFVRKRTRRVIFSSGLDFMTDEKRAWNWARGLWGSCGSLYIPKAGYHFVMRPPEDSICTDRIEHLFKKFNITYGTRVRNGNKEIMVRDQQQIVDILSGMGFVQTVLKLEDTSIVRSMRSHANQLVNCDSANIKKSIQTAAKHMELIKQIEDSGVICTLPDTLTELVLARKANPEATLSELGKSLSTPISKSTVKYRWLKLENHVKAILKGDGANVPGKSRR